MYSNSKKANSPRTTSEAESLLTKCGGSVGDPVELAGAVSVVVVNNTVDVELKTTVLDNQQVNLDTTFNGVRDLVDLSGCDNRNVIPFSVDRIVVPCRVESDIDGGVTIEEVAERIRNTIEIWSLPWIDLICERGHTSTFLCNRLALGE